MSQSLMSEPYILLVWIVAGIITIFGAFTIAGLASMTSETGGIYEYLRLIYGDFIAFLLGWTYFTIVGMRFYCCTGLCIFPVCGCTISFSGLAPCLQDISIAHFIFPFRGLSVKLLAMS